MDRNASAVSTLGIMLNVSSEGCPIHPTKVDSSLVFAIRQTGNQFVNTILWNRQESFSGSPFARDLENIVDLDFEGGWKTLSIRLDSIESTRIVSPIVDSSYRKSISTRLRKYS